MGPLPRAIMVACLGVLALAAFSLTRGTAVAQAIGEMAEVVGNVRGTIGSVLHNGDSVVQDETVATAAASTARVAFHDLTSLMLAPESAVKLDRYIYGGSASVAQASIRLTRGAFRFITGNSPSQNFTIRTPKATIGLRGTTLDIEVLPSREIVWLRQGEAVVCRNRQCVTLDLPGAGVFVTQGGISAASTAPRAVFDFDARSFNRFPLFGPR